MQEPHVLVKNDLESIQQPENLHRRTHLDQVVVGVRAPDVDLLIEGALAQRLHVVRDVLAEVTRLAVRANEDPPFFVVDRLARLEPDRAILLVDLSKLPELGERLFEVARTHQLGLREPGVVVDAEHRRHALGLA